MCSDNIHCNEHVRAILFIKHPGLYAMIHHNVLSNVYCYNIYLSLFPMLQINFYKVQL